MKISISKNRAFSYLLVFIIIYVSDDTLLFGTSEGTFFGQIKYLIFMVLTGFLAINKVKYVLTDVLLLILLFGLIGATMISNADFRGGYIYQILTILLSFFIARRMDFKVFVEIFIKVMYFFSTASLVGYAIALFFPFLLNFFPTVTNLTGKEMHNLILTVVHYTGGLNIRNNGVFREPGVFMFYLNLALMFCLFYSQQKKAYIIVFLLCLATAASTAGIFVAGLILTTFLFSKQAHLSTRNKALMIGIIAIGVSVFFASGNLIQLVFGKLSSDSSSNISTLSRVSSLFVPVDIFIENLFFGAGLSDFSIQFEEISWQMYGIPFSTDGNATNTIMNKLATYGGGFGLVFIIGAYMFVVRVFKRGFFFNLAIFVVFLMMFSNEDFRYSLLFNVLIFYGFDYYLHDEQRVEEAGNSLSKV